MVEGAKGPSRLVQSVARWAITLGAAGTIVGCIALYRVLINDEAAADRHGLLVLSAGLLSMAFVLAPFVRRTFGNPFEAPRATPVQRTLLEELREAPDTAGGTQPAPAPEPAPVATPMNAEAPTISFTTRVIAVVYAMFAATLLLILWVLQTRS